MRILVWVTVPTHWTEEQRILLKDQITAAVDSGGVVVAEEGACVEVIQLDGHSVQLGGGNVTLR